MLLYVAWVVKTLRNEATAEASLAAILDRNRFGIAIAAMIRMIATTIKSSIREKPFCSLTVCSPWKLNPVLMPCQSTAPLRSNLRASRQASPPELA